jgi:hypothetical protein
MRRRVRGDEGMSLAEALVATALTVLIVSLLGSLAVSTQRASRQTIGKLDGQGQARAAMDAISKTLRSAQPPHLPGATAATAHACVPADKVGEAEAVLSGSTENNLVVYSSFGGAASPKKYVYRVTPASELVEEVHQEQTVSGTRSCVKTSERTLLRGMVVSGSEPFFTFLPSDVESDSALGAPAPVPTASAFLDSGVDPNAGARRLSAADVKQVSRVRVDLRVKGAAGADPVEVVSVVRLSTKYFNPGS